MNYHLTVSQAPSKLDTILCRMRFSSNLFLLTNDDDEINRKYVCEDKSMATNY
jgi:hypothetical protein